MTVSKPDRKYDIEDRLLAFTERVLGVVEALPPTRTGNHIAGQLTRCGTSPLANYAEAQGGESRADFVHKLRVALKELRETRVWLLLRAYPNHPLASAGCGDRSRRRAASTTQRRVACFALLACGRLARPRADEGVFG